MSRERRRLSQMWPRFGDRRNSMFGPIVHYSPERWHRSHRNRLTTWRPTRKGYGGRGSGSGQAQRLFPISSCDSLILAISGYSQTWLLPPVPRFLFSVGHPRPNPTFPGGQPCPPTREHATGPFDEIRALSIMPAFTMGEQGSVVARVYVTTIPIAATLRVAIPPADHSIRTRTIFVRCARDSVAV